MSPLHVLVGRARPQAEATAGRLVAAGHVPILAPLTEIVPRPLPARLAGLVDAIVVTSANAVPAVLTLRARLGRLPVFAVGEATAAALAGAGLTDAMVGGGDGAALAVAIAAALRPGARILHPAGRDRRPEPEASLRRAGFAVEVLEAYAAEAVTSLPETARVAFEEGRVDAVLHYSARGAFLMGRLAGEAGHVAGLRRATQLCLSAEVAEALDAVTEGTRILVASRPDETALLALLDRLAPGPRDRT